MNLFFLNSLKLFDKLSLTENSYKYIKYETHRGGVI